MDKKTSPISYLIPILLIVFLIALIWGETYLPSSNQASTDEINTPLPTISLPNLFEPEKNITNNDFPRGQVFLLHVWGSWCAACRKEHNILMKIYAEKLVPIYSIDYKDNPEDAKTMLNDEGNPYVLTAMDPTGQISRSLGVYGTPQTFIIDKHGIIRYRQLGIITEETWNDKLLPLINQYKNSN